MLKAVDMPIINDNATDSEIENLMVELSRMRDDMEYLDKINEIK